jgi:type II secretory pathway pseudopilin PulG
MATLQPEQLSESGTTLVEVVMAMAILAIGILAVGAMQTTSMRSTGTTRDNTEASALAARQLEILIRQSQERREGYYGYLDDPDLQDTDRDGLGGLNDASEAAADHHPTSLHPVYRLYWIGTKIIRIIVIWTDRGVERRYPLEYIAVDII